VKRAVALVVAAGCAVGQNSPTVTGSGYALPAPVKVAPGQLITLFFKEPTDISPQGAKAPAGADLPGSLRACRPDSTGSLVCANYGGSFSETGTSSFMAVQEVRPVANCGATACNSWLTAIIVQIPFELQAVGSATLYIGDTAFPPGYGLSADAVVYPDQIHIRSACDTLAGDFRTQPVDSSGLPCASTVTHVDGSVVSFNSPATAGEELVAYAVGLGQTTPPLTTGKLVTAAAPTQATLGLDFNYRPNALAAKPLPSAPAPIFAGATPGYVGLYQVNFVVPPVPSGTPPCADPSTVPFGQNVVQSNLTVSVGGKFSFDGARICVAVPSQ